jgi:hypothetical protein
VVQRLPSKCDALSSNPGTTKKKEKEGMRDRKQEEMQNIWIALETGEIPYCFFLSCFSNFTY